MNNFMMWFDNDAKTALSAKIEKAVDYYRHKYGSDPNLCLVNPSMLAVGQEMTEIVVRPYRPVLPGHLWIGVEEKS